MNGCISALLLQHVHLRCLVAKTVLLEGQNRWVAAAVADTFLLYQWRPVHCPAPAPWQQVWREMEELGCRRSSPMQLVTTAPCSASVMATSSPYWSQRLATAGTTEKTRRQECRCWEQNKNKTETFDKAWACLSSFHSDFCLYFPASSVSLSCSSKIFSVVFFADIFTSISPGGAGFPSHIPGWSQRLMEARWDNLEYTSRWIFHFYFLSFFLYLFK